MQRQSYPSPIITLKVQNHHHLSTSPPLLIGEPPFESPSICSNVPWRHCLAWQLFFRARLSIMISAQGIPGFSSKKKTALSRKYVRTKNIVMLQIWLLYIITCFRWLNIPWSWSSSCIQWKISWGSAIWRKSLARKSMVKVSWLKRG